MKSTTSIISAIAVVLLGVGIYFSLNEKITGNVLYDWFLDTWSEMITPSRAPSAVEAPTDGVETAACGNNAVDDGEQCDGSDVNGENCILLGFASGNLGCYSNCTFDSMNCLHEGAETGGGFGDGSPPPTSDCGNGVIEPGESCEGSDFGTNTCMTWGYDSGLLSCNDTCIISTEYCFHDTEDAEDGYCGDSMINDAENCDGADLGAATCETFGYVSGILGCTTGCNFDFNSCSNCGNNIQDADENCDGADFGTLSCETFFRSGTLGCTVDCSLDFSNCTN